MERFYQSAIADKTTGLIILGEWVTREATHLGVKQQLTLKITEYENSNYFEDKMVISLPVFFKQAHIFKESCYINLLYYDRYILFPVPFWYYKKLANIIF